MKYKVLFNEDCMMYGVYEYINTGYKLYSDGGKFTYIKKWTQALPPKGKGARHGKSAYTYYKGVAERWMKELEAQV